MASVTIVLPAYNEEGAIGPVLDALRALRIDAEIVVVDDASTDRTAAVAAEHGARVVRHPMNRGYGRSLKSGVEAASTDVIITSDADGTYPIGQIPLLVETFQRGFDMVVGARQGASYRGSPFKWMLRGMLRMIVTFSSGQRIPDVNSGMRVFRRKTAMPYFPDICDGFSFTTTITLIYLLTNKAVTFVPIPYHKRVGRSKVKMLRDSLRTLQYVTECIVRYNPLKLFLLLGGLTVLVGVIGTSLLGLPSLLFGLLFAFLLFGLGLIAESLRRPRQ